MDFRLTEVEAQLAISALNTQAAYFIEQANKPTMPAVVRLAYHKTADEYTQAAITLEAQIEFNRKQLTQIRKIK